MTTVVILRIVDRRSRTRSQKPCVSPSPTMWRGWREPRADEMLTLSLYERPLDYPKHYVLRAWYVNEFRAYAATPVLLFRSMREAEEFVNSAYPHMTWIGREMGEKTSALVVGCWLPTTSCLVES